MRRMPLILVSPNSQARGAEFEDASLSLSNRYAQAIAFAGGLPVVMPILHGDEDIVAETVLRCDGLLLTGGDDVEIGLYAPEAPCELRRKAGPSDPARDLLELLLIDEVFRQGKPLLAICRGQQILNVALGGTLLVDIETQRPDAPGHNRIDRKDEIVHEVALTNGSVVSRIMGKPIVGVNSSHHQAVDRIAEALKPTAISRDGIIEALELKDEGALPFLLAVQFHPERLWKKHKPFLNLFKFFVQSCTLAANKTI